LFSLASRSWSANRLVLIMKLGQQQEAAMMPRLGGFFEVPTCQ
jgi:hypothetical protein